MDKTICRREHQLCSSDERCKSICTVWVPLEVRQKDTNGPIQFHVRFDVINGGLQFLMVLPSPKAIGAALNFRYSNLSLVTNPTVYQLNLIHQPLHLRLSIVRESSNTRSLNTKQARSHFTRPSPLTKGKHVTTPDTANVNPEWTHWIGNRFKITFENQETDAPSQSDSMCHHEPLTAPQLKKIHNQLGYSTLAQMKSLIKELKKRKPE